MKCNYNPVEILKFEVETPNLAQRFLDVDKRTWTDFLSKQPGYITKYCWYTDTRPSTIFTIIIWQSKEQWKAIDTNQLISVASDFEQQLGFEYQKLAMFDERHHHPLRKVYEKQVLSLEDVHSKQLCVEYLIFEIDNLESFIDADERIWTDFLMKQPGFISKQQWVREDKPNELHSIVFWESKEQFIAIELEQLIKQAKEFESINDSQLMYRLHEEYDNKLVLYNI